MLFLIPPKKSFVCIGGVQVDKRIYMKYGMEKNTNIFVSSLTLTTPLRLSESN